MSGALGKYGNRRTTVGAEVFDSKAEADDWVLLCLREHAGQIQDLKRQVCFVLLPAFTDRAGKRQRAITWTADFTYTEEGQLIAHDTKGRVTDRFSIVSKWFTALYPEIKLVVHHVESKRRRR